MAKKFIITEEQLERISKEKELTEYKFLSNIRHFLAELLEDPVNAPVPLSLALNGYRDRNRLIDELTGRGIIVKKERLSDKDEYGNPKPVTMMVSYSVPKDGFNKKLRHMFYDVFCPHDDDKDVVTEDGGGATSAGASGSFVGPLFSSRPISRKIGQ